MNLVEEALTQAETPKQRVKVETPPDTTVTLAAGFMDPIDGFVNSAEVRELNGADEEAIAKAADTGKALLTILERAVVKIGDQPATKELLDLLLAGDRELLLFTIRRVTFGDEVSFEGQLCIKCTDTQKMTVNLNEDVKIKSLDGSRSFTLDCKVGTVEVELPTGATQKALINSNNKTAAELDTLVLKSCIKSINGMPILDSEQARQLSIKDRRDILKAISDRNPGPQLNEIVKSCQICGSEVPLPLTLADLFQE